MLALCVIRSGGLTLRHLANLDDRCKQHDSITLIALDYDGGNADQLNHVLQNESGTPEAKVGPRTDLPPKVKKIPSKPPEGFPEFDPANPDETDFQLQQALVVAKAMAAAQNHIIAD